MSKAYFSTDGSFGDAQDLEIIDTSDWTGEEWDEVQNEMDCFRLATALAITRSKKNKPEPEATDLATINLVLDKIEEMRDSGVFHDPTLNELKQRLQ